MEGMEKQRQKSVFFEIWGKFLVVSAATLIITAGSLAWKENVFVEAKGKTPEPIYFLSGEPTQGFQNKENSFSLNTQSFTKNTLIQFYGEDILEIFPDSTVNGTFFNEKNPSGLPRLTIHLLKGKIASYRLSSLPETQIFAVTEMVFQGEGSFLIDFMKDFPVVTAARYPVIAATLPATTTALPPQGPQDFETSSGRSGGWQSFFNEALSLKFIFPENVSEEARMLFERDTEFRKQKTAKAEKEARERGFYFRTPDGIGYGLAKSKFNAANLFSLRSELEKERREVFAERVIEDAAFELLLRNPERAKERLSKIISLSSPEWSQWSKRFSYASFDHPWYSLDQDLRAQVLNNLSFDDPQAREEKFELLAKGLNLSFDLQALGLGMTEQRGAVIVFSEELLRHAHVRPLAFFEGYLESLATQPDFFDALFLKGLVALQDKIAEQKSDQRAAYLASRRNLFESGKNYFEQGLIPFVKGREALLFLLGEMADQRDDMLKSDGVFVTFLLSPEAEEKNKSFREQYDAFIAREEETEKIEQILAGETGVTQEVRGSAQYAAEAVSDLKEAGIELIAFTTRADDPNLIDIQEGRAANQVFSGMYDVSRKIFSNIKAGNEKYDRSVSLQNASAFIRAVSNIKRTKRDIGATAPSEQKPFGDENSRIERVLKSKVMEKLDLLQIVFDEKNIEIQDTEKGFFLIKDAGLQLDGREKVTATFQFLNSKNEVSDVSFEGPTGPLVITDSFPLSSLKDRVEILYNRAKLDKEREEASLDPAAAAVF